MRPIGFSTGALALADVRRALAMLSKTEANAVELSALRIDELEPLVNLLPDLDLSQFTYRSFHAPSAIPPDDERTTVKLLANVAQLGWHIIVHPNVIRHDDEWAAFGELLCIENMDKRKAVGQTAADLSTIFERFPNASFCFDLGHARQVDPTMSEACAILGLLRDKLAQLHVSEVNTQSKHDPLTLEAVWAFNRIAPMIPEDVPLILESRVSDEWAIKAEFATALQALNPERVLAYAGD